MHLAAGDLHKAPRSGPRLEGAGAFEAPAGRDFPPHQHTTWELIYYRTGHIQCPVGEAIYDSEPGMILLTPPATVHAEYARTAYANYFLTVAAPPLSPWPRVCFDNSERAFGTLFGVIVREWRGQANGREEMLDLLIGQLDILLRREDEQERLSPSERLVREAERIIEEHSATPLRISDVARELGVSPSWLRSHFGRQRDGTPKAYLQSLRLQRALALIRNASLSLDEIAHLAGYHSASHLSRHVKRATGRSPGSLRAARDEYLPPAERPASWPLPGPG